MRILDKKSWPYRISIREPNQKRHDLMTAWLYENVGYREWELVEQSGACMDFYFIDEKMATMFALAWT
jgi:hypothetical protein